MAFKGYGDIDVSAVFEKVLALHRPECYDDSGEPMNLFRSTLFCFQAVVFFGVVIASVLKARFFIRFALAVAKYNLNLEPKELMESVKELYDKFYKPSNEGDDVHRVEDEPVETDDVDNVEDLGSIVAVLA